MLQTDERVYVRTGRRKECDARRNGANKMQNTCIHDQYHPSLWTKTSSSFSLASYCIPGIPVLVRALVYAGAKAS